MITRNNPPIVTLISDFGLQDEYAGVMKGVILTHAPEARIVDISHLIPPQSIRTATYLLIRSYRFFPAHTVHMVVVDPGVGSDRAILAMTADSHYFVGPDNGVFTPLFDHATNPAIYRATISHRLQRNISSTFHGRDILAPIAGQLAMGREISELGSKISAEQCLRLEEAPCIRQGCTLQGEVIHIDAFGNLCTNIRRQDVSDFAIRHDITIEMKNGLVVPLKTTYADGIKGTILALYDSHDHLEIAMNQGHAAQHLSLAIGDKIVLSHQ